MEWIAYATGKVVDKLESVTAKAKAELDVDRLNYYERLKELESHMENVLQLHQEAEEQLRSTQQQLSNEQERCERQAFALSIAQQAAKGWRESFTVAHAEVIDLRAKGRNAERAYAAMCEALDSRKWWAAVSNPLTDMVEIFSSQSMARAAHPKRTIRAAKLIG
jgi:hypothetical protein